MKTILLFTHPQAVLGGYEFLLSGESNQLYKKLSWLFPALSLQWAGVSVPKHVK